MKVSDQPLITIVGPTGIGKTSLALDLAQKLDAEIISADSRQVYTGMDIATGKEVNQGVWVDIDGRKTLVINKIPIHGLDLAYPDLEFSVFDWLNNTQPIITEIMELNKQPIIVGGTGFYLQALQGRIKTLAFGSNQNLRERLVKLTVKELQDELKKSDSNKWGSLNYSDQQNPARLIRAIEVVQAQNASQAGQSKYIRTHNNYKLLMIGLTMDREALYAKVDARIEQMFDLGLIEETKRLLQKYNPNLPSMSGIGYAEVAMHLRGDISVDEARQKMKWRTHAYIRRQYTWFRKQPVYWIDIDQAGWKEKITSLLLRYN